MVGLRKTSLILLILTVWSDATMTTKEARTTGLPEKIIGGVIEIVHSHKNKPAAQQSFQQTYPTNGYQPPAQYPQYQWNGQSNYQLNQQGQGFNYHGQYQNPGQYNYQNQNGYNQGSYPPSNGNYGPPATTGFNGQTQTQGQYQIVYQNQPSQPQYQPVATTGQSGQYQNNQQVTQQFQQNQTPGHFQHQNTGHYQVQQPSNNLQGQTGSFQGQGHETGGQQGFNVSGGQQATGTGTGPTCVCQAWTKPTDTLNDPAAEKTEKMADAPAM